MGDRNKESSIEYFKTLVEAINSDYIGFSNIWNRFGKFFPLRLKNKVKHILKKDSDKNTSSIDYSKIIESIIFYDSICAIKKYSVLKDDKFKSVITGNENLGNINCYENELETVNAIRNMFGK